MRKNYVSVRIYADKDILERFLKQYRKYSDKTIEDILDIVYRDNSILSRNQYVLTDKKFYSRQMDVCGIYYKYPAYTFIDISYLTNNVEESITIFSIIASFFMEKESYRIYYASESNNDVRYDNYDESRFGKRIRYTVEFYSDEDDYEDDCPDELCLSDYDKIDYPSKYGMICSLNNIFKKHYTMETETSEIEKDIGCQINETYPGLTNEYLTDECPWLKKNLD